MARSVARQHQHVAAHQQQPWHVMKAEKRRSRRRNNMYIGGALYARRSGISNHGWRQQRINKIIKEAASGIIGVTGGISASGGGSEKKWRHQNDIKM